MKEPELNVVNKIKKCINKLKSKRNLKVWNSFLRLPIDSFVGIITGFKIENWNFDFRINEQETSLILHWNNKIGIEM